MKTRSFNIEFIIRQNLKGLKSYSSARDDYISDGSQKIFLDANENPYGDGLNRYPDPHQRKLKAVLSELKAIPEDQILLGNGSDEILDLIFRAFCEPGKDRVITVPPTYGMYKVLAGINDIENKEVCLTNSFELDVDGILNAVTDRTKMILLCSPNNPTANRFRDLDIERILMGFDGVLVLDEAYIDFSSSESWLKRLADFPNLIITQTLSKAYGLAGIRLGICYASAEIIKVLQLIKPPYNVNELTQQAALERLRENRLLNQQVAEIIRERKRLAEALEKVTFITEVFPSDANFLLARVDDAGKRYDQILEAGVVVRNRSDVPLCENCLRFTVGTSEENDQLLIVLNSI